MKKKIFVFDFDSTFTQVEALEELAAISLKNDPEKDFIIEKVKQLTDLAMEGKMPFNKSLKARIALLSAKKYHLNMLVNRLRKKVSVSVARNKQFFKHYQGQIIIVSGGFKEFIVPVVKPYFIDESCVFGNTFVYDKKNNIVGVDETNLLAQEQGKVKLLRKMYPDAEVQMIGDGFTDYEVRREKVARSFFAFTENVARQLVTEKADFVVPSLDEFLYLQKLPMALSYPKSRIHAVLCGEETFAAEKYFRNEGYQVSKILQNTTTIAAKLEQASVAVVSKKFRLDKKLHTPKLLASAIWGTGGSQTTAQAFTLQGIPVFEAPYAASRSIAELALGFMIALARNNFASNQTATELKDKKIGIAGMDASGQLLAVLCQGLGMEVLYFDEQDTPPIANAQVCKGLGDLLKKSEMVVLLNPIKTKLAAKELRLLPAGSYLINLCQDDTVDLIAVQKALHEKRLAGFATDCENPRTKLQIATFANSVVTLNARGNTMETQQNIAGFVSEKIIQYINTGNTSASVNFPNMQLPGLQNSHRFIHIHKNKPGMLAKINAVFARNKINITGQYLKTNEQIGYVITDVAKQYNKKVTEELKTVEGTIRFRVLY